MRRAVESLVIAFDKAGDFLEPPAPVPVSPPAAVGRMVGPYRIVGEIGQGGMGTVYRATRADEQ